MSDENLNISCDAQMFARANEALRAEVDRLRAENERLARARAIVDEQAEDEGLWCPAVTATEAYLQQELRRLHAAVEGER